MLIYTRSAPGFCLHSPSWYLQMSALLRTSRPFGPLAVCFVCFILWSKEKVWPSPLTSPGPWVTRSCHWASLFYCLRPLWTKAVLWGSLSFIFRAPEVKQTQVPSIKPLSQSINSGLVIYHPSSRLALGGGVKKASCKDLIGSKLSSFTLEIPFSEDGFRWSSGSFILSLNSSRALPFKTQTTSFKDLLWDSKYILHFFFFFYIPAILWKKWMLDQIEGAT